ncbi:hypothetical protein [Thiolapillus sp.]
MIPTLFGLVAAMIFSIVTYMIYGLEGVMLRDWIDQVFLGLIFTGMAIGVANAIWRCLPCQLSKLAHSEKLSDIWCNSCGH